MISKACGRILFIFCVISSVSHASAQGPPIQTDTPIMLGLEGRGIRTFGKIIRQATLLREGTEIEDPMGRSVTLLLTPLAVPYNFLSSRLQVGLVLPFMRIGVNSKEGEFSSTGLGDASIFAKYLVYQHDRRNKTIRVASKFGVKFPTGDEKAQPALGSGSTDYFISTVAGWIAGRMGIYLEGRFTWNTSREAINFGNAIFYNMAFGYRLLPIIYETYPSPQLNGFLEINGITVYRSRIDHRAMENTGGTSVFLSPGLQYIGGRRWLIEASFQYPVINRPNGTQLAVDWNLSIGSRILLF